MNGLPDPREHLQMVREDQQQAWTPWPENGKEIIDVQEVQLRPPEWSADNGPDKLGSVPPDLNLCP